MSAVLFPKFTHGPFLSLRRTTLKEGKRWARSHKTTGAFPALDLIPIEPGTLVVTEDVSDLERIDKESSRWRLYFVRRLRDDILRALPESQDWAGASDAFEKYVGPYPWGALDLALGHSGRRDAEVVSRRLEAVFSFWPDLDLLRYMDAFRKEVGLAELLRASYADLISLWLDRPTGDTRQDLRAALDAARAAGRDELCGRLARRMAAQASTMQRLSNGDCLSDPAWVLSRLTAFDDARLETMRTADDLRKQIYLLDEGV